MTIILISNFGRKYNFSNLKLIHFFIKFFYILEETHDSTNCGTKGFSNKLHHGESCSNVSQVRFYDLFSCGIQLIILPLETIEDTIGRKELKSGRKSQKFLILWRVQRNQLRNGKHHGMPLYV